MTILEEIRKRRAIREFKPQMIRDGDLHDILEAGRLSPSSKNSQPTRFLVVKNKETLLELSNLTHSGSHLPKAPLGIAVFTKDAKMPEVDATRAIQNMVMVAWELGIGTCWITNYNEDMAKKLLEIPLTGRYRFITCMPYGYIREEDKPRGLKRRFPLEEIVYYEKFSEKNS